MARADTAFEPRRHGFQFVNRFVLAPAITLPGGKHIRLGERVVGLCGGMCYAALDYYHAGRPVPTCSEPPEPGTPLFRYLLQRQIATLANPGVPLKLVSWMLRDDQRLAQRTARNEFPKARRHLDAGEPVVVLLVRTASVRRLEENHQVVVSGYAYDDVTDRLTLSVYDPNHPHPAREVEIAMTLPKDGVEQALQQSTGERLRGFFLLAYRPRRRDCQSWSSRAILARRNGPMRRISRHDAVPTGLVPLPPVSAAPFWRARSRVRCITARCRAYGSVPPPPVSAAPFWREGTVPCGAYRGMMPCLRVCARVARLSSRAIPARKTVTSSASRHDAAATPIPLSSGLDTRPRHTILASRTRENSSRHSRRGVRPTHVSRDCNGYSSNGDQSPVRSG